jgi:hypothetical protein
LLTPMMWHKLPRLGAHKFCAPALKERTKAHYTICRLVAEEARVLWKEYEEVCKANPKKKEAWTGTHINLGDYLELVI